MRRVRPFVASLLAALVLLGTAETLFAAALCESSLPFNVDAGTLEPIAIALLQQSPTFRQQCERIAATVVVRVQVRLVPRLHAGAKAETVIRRYDTGALRAEVSVAFGGDYIELLAHEFEHVLEQIEHVDLQQLTAAQQGWMTPDGAFETRRAIEVGARARQECDLSAAEALEAHRRPAPRQRNPIE